MLDRMRRILNEVPEGSRAVIYGPKNRISQMTGQHRQNIEILKAEYGLESIRIIPLEDGEIRAETEEKQQ